MKYKKVLFWIPKITFSKKYIYRINKREYIKVIDEQLKKQASQLTKAHEIIDKHIEFIENRNKEIKELRTVNAGKTTDIGNLELELTRTRKNLIKRNKEIAELKNHIEVLADKIMIKSRIIRERNTKIEEKIDNIVSKHNEKASIIIHDLQQKINELNRDIIKLKR